MIVQSTYKNNNNKLNKWHDYIDCTICKLTYNVEYMINDICKYCYDYMCDICGSNKKNLYSCNECDNFVCKKCIDRNSYGRIFKCKNC